MLCALITRTALKNHPDKNNTPEAVEIFKEAAAAYEILSDEQKRMKYDSFGMSYFRRMNAEDHNNNTNNNSESPEHYQQQQQQHNIKRLDRTISEAGNAEDFLEIL